MRLAIILHGIVGSLAASLSEQISGQYGSDLHLPLSKLCQELFLDIYDGDTQIGNYVDDILQGFKAFKDRLQFDRESCTFTIKSFSKADGHTFKFTNYGPTVRMDFKVFVPVVRNIADEYTSDECTSGLFALGLSINPIISLIFIILAEKMKEQCWNDGEIVSCIKQAVISILGKGKRSWINFACIFIKVVSLVCKVISLISLVCCGRIHGTDCLFINATSFTVIDGLLAAVWIYFTSKCNEGNLNPLKRNQSFCYILEAAQSLSFLAFIYFLYFSQYKANANHLVCVLVVSPLIFVILKIMIFILYRRRLKKRTTNLKEKLALDTDDLL